VEKKIVQVLVLVCWSFEYDRAKRLLVNIHFTPPQWLYPEDKSGLVSFIDE